MSLVAAFFLTGAAPMVRRIPDSTDDEIGARHSQNRVCGGNRLPWQREHPVKLYGLD
jgi:hypothetical protein